MIPNDATERKYDLIFWVYDEDGDIFENDEDDEAEFEVSFTVEGSCSSAAKALVSATLESGGKAGKKYI